MEEPNVMINYATENNQPWEGIENLFIDSGGYSFIKGKGEYQTSDSQYLEFIKRVQPEIFALRDYPCESKVLEEHGRTVEKHQEMTTKRHRKLLDLWSDAWWQSSQPVCVIQGWELDDYLRHLDQLRENGLLTDYVGIGSVCRRNQDEQIRDIVMRIRQELPPRCKLHAFGVKKNILRFPDAFKALDSADSMAYEDSEKYSQRVSGTKRKSFRDSALSYLQFKRKINSAIIEDDEMDRYGMRCEQCGQLLPRIYVPASSSGICAPCIA